ncbi:hypothetical protein AAY473_006485 [Plecturocebus cupreus]
MINSCGSVGRSSSRAVTHASQHPRPMGRPGAEMALQKCPKVWWLTPVIPTLWEAKVGRSQGQEFENNLANMNCDFMLQFLMKGKGVGGAHSKTETARSRALNWCFRGELEFHHVSQAGLKLLTSSDLPTSASQSARITGVSHCAQPEKTFLSREHFDMSPSSPCCFCLLSTLLSLSFPAAAFQLPTAT